MIKRNKIAFDLDGVLIDLDSILEGQLKEKTGLDFSGLTEYSVTKCLPIEEDILEECLDYCYRQYANIAIYPGVKEVIRELWDQTEDPITVITARPIFWATETHILVKRVCGEIPYRLIFSDGISKSIYLGDYPYFAEDRRKTALELTEMGKQVFLVDKIYNQCEHHLITRIKDLTELLPLINLFIDEE